MTIALISLGSNIEPEANLVQAVHLLRGYGQVLALSPVYQTPPTVYLDQDDFLNMAVKLETDHALLDFKTQVIVAIEKTLKRVRDPNNKAAPRTIDLDIALWGSLVADYGERPWHVPEPDVVRYAHVALPLADIAPDFVHPEEGRTLQAIANQFDASAFVRRQDIVFD